MVLSEKHIAPVSSRTRKCFLTTAGEIFLEKNVMANGITDLGKQIHL
jgi:hypothetical protein